MFCCHEAACLGHEASFFTIDTFSMAPIIILFLMAASNENNKSSSPGNDGFQMADLPSAAETLIPF